MCCVRTVSCVVHVDIRLLYFDVVPVLPKLFSLADEDYKSVKGGIAVDDECECETKSWTSATKECSESPLPTYSANQAWAGEYICRVHMPLPCHHNYYCTLRLRAADAKPT